VIAVIPSPVRDGITGPLIGGAQPVRDAVTEALLAQDCGNSTYITVADIALGGVTGAGSVGLELGGVQATTAEIDGFQFQLPPAVPALPPAVTDLPLTDAAGLPAAGAASPPAAGAVPEPAANPSPVAVAPAAAGFAGERGGLMAAIAGGGLVLMLATAEADRRKMRSAQRAIPLES
jgi:hypothetical protein